MLATIIREPNILANSGCDKWLLRKSKIKSLGDQNVNHSLYWNRCQDKIKEGLAQKGERHREKGELEIREPKNRTRRNFHPRRKSYGLLSNSPNHSSQIAKWRKSRRQKCELMSDFPHFFSLLIRDWVGIAIFRPRGLQRKRKFDEGDDAFPPFLDNEALTMFDGWAASTFTSENGANLMQISGSN